ncbi:hypothetical protein [Ruegeria lacuscaerulensis]|uniref:hypothetical protein n=1 Tax=Ruegeria lacuscaerulensis TaxID=55218 RepID=UPI00147D7607|nr:hypothetical protein [Ruegeria lacuscaerulensis]
MTIQTPIVTDEAKFDAGTQAIRSTHWPFGRRKFHEMVKANLIKPHFAHAGARPIYYVEEIDAVFQPLACEKLGRQWGPKLYKH